MGVEKLRELVAVTNVRQPGLVFLLGDYVIQGVVGGRFIAPETTARELGRPSAPLGTFAVLGNHDHWLDAARVRAALEAAGIPVVDDRRVGLVDRGCSFSVVGLLDAWSDRPDVAAVMRQVPAGEPTLLLTHNPTSSPHSAGLAARPGGEVADERPGLEASRRAPQQPSISQRVVL